jgi:hypothetical protein
MEQSDYERGINDGLQIALNTINEALKKNFENVGTAAVYLFKCKKILEEKHGIKE